MTGIKGVFQDVDSSGVAPNLMAYLDRVAARPEMVELRAHSYARLGIAPGHRVLEVGCGLGHAVADIARIVGPAGHVLGLDISTAMAAEAQRRVSGPTVEVRVGDLLALDLPDESYDIVRAERVFQHITETARACAEVARVLRPGGRVGIVDSDWTSLRVVGPDSGLTAEVLAAWEAVHTNPRGVVDLPPDLLDAGLGDIEILGTVHVSHDLADAAEKMPMLSQEVPVDRRPISPELGERWFAALDAADAAGRLWVTLTLWTLVARKA